jgi:uncharacterized protein YjbJ (UPF0337 family)
MARPGSTWRLVVLLSLVYLVVLPVAIAGPARGLPIDKPVDHVGDRLGGARDRANNAVGGVGDRANNAVGGVGDRANNVIGGVKDQANDVIGGVKDSADGALGKVRQKAADSVGRVTDEVQDAASQLVRPIVRAAGDAGWLGPAGQSGLEQAAHLLPGADQRMAGAGEEAEQRSAGTVADEGDVNELARGGNEIVSPGPEVQSGVGLSVPLPGAGGINPPLSFTGWDLIIALLASLLLTSMGLALLSADGRRTGRRVAPLLIALRPTGHEMAVAGD